MNLDEFDMWITEAKQKRDALKKAGIEFKDDAFAAMVLERSIGPFAFFGRDNGKEGGYKQDTGQGVTKQTAVAGDGKTDKKGRTLYDGGPCKHCKGPTSVPFKPKFQGGLVCGACYRKGLV